MGWILYLAVGSLAVAGLAQICLALGRWLGGGTAEEKGRFLVLAARGDDPAMEMKIRGACAEVQSNRRMRGAGVVVVNCGAGAETMEVCHRLCADLSLPLLEPEELLVLLAGE